ATGQPARVAVLVIAMRDRGIPWHADAEEVLGIVGDALGIAMAPLQEDLVAVGDLPVRQHVRRDADTGLFPYLAAGGFGQGFARLLAAGDRLPEAGVPLAFELEDLQVLGMNDDEDRDRDFLGDDRVLAHRRVCLRRWRADRRSTRRACSPRATRWRPRR